MFQSRRCGAGFGGSIVRPIFSQLFSTFFSIVSGTRLFRRLKTAWKSGVQATALAAEPHDAVVASTTSDARIWVSSACLSNVERRRADVELELRLSLHALAEMADERVVAHALAPHLDRSPAAHHPRNTYRSANLSSNLRSVTLSEYEAGALVRRSSSAQVTSRRSRGNSAWRYAPQIHPSAPLHLPRPVLQACPAGRKDMGSLLQPQGLEGRK